ncbi:MAG: bifunctional methylenetetrahydrofolate dehydrogenase/methenyltetrahydrofolate cyclohydrolase FolD [Parcubacteria group bacterium]|jgi:methylenetetrahydrofolate dehydrogenase (NADP+)/methenyltetrahydrofolate cyclohydrolase
MNAKIIDGKKISAQIKEELRAEVEELKKKNIMPGLAVVIVGVDPASTIYVHNKKKAAKDLGIYSEVYEMPENTKEEELIELINKLNKNEKIHGVLVQLPLPKHINEERIILTIDPKKDVDCFHPENIGKVMIGGAIVFPCTPAGIVELLKRSKIEISGRDCVVIGRSNIVGKPAALMLLQENATVTICHSKTKDLKKYCLEADIIIAAVGKAKMVTADMIKNGAVVIDVGINRLPDGKLVGDVDFGGVIDKISAITPVPGGVGPMTIAMLMKNTINIAKNYENRN